jgi:hypothetical protein
MDPSCAVNKPMSLVVSELVGRSNPRRVGRTVVRNQFRVQLYELFGRFPVGKVCVWPTAWRRGRRYSQFRQPDAQYSSQRAIGRNSTSNCEWILVVPVNVEATIFLFCPDLDFFVNDFEILDHSGAGADRRAAAQHGPAGIVHGFLVDRPLGQPIVAVFSVPPEVSAAPPWRCHL